MHLTLGLAVAVRPGLTVLTLTGDLDMDTSPYLAEATDSLDLQGRILTLDLSAVTFIDSCGLTTLLAVRQHIGLAGGTLKLADLPYQALRLLDLTGTRDLFTLAEPAPTPS
ncbi:STAS domain-containing protein [Streptomyces virginiae]|uniref:STAS domain-containing protein n=1 Tax=Streptomyces virginiae TaxID=1961 RepID=UPI00363C1F0F